MKTLFQNAANGYSNVDEHFRTEMTEMNLKKLIKYGAIIAPIVYPKVKNRLGTNNLRKSYSDSHRTRMSGKSILDKL